MSKKIILLAVFMLVSFSLSFTTNALSQVNVSKIIKVQESNSSFSKVINCTDGFTPMYLVNNINSSDGYKAIFTPNEINCTDGFTPIYFPCDINNSELFTLLFIRNNIVCTSGHSPLFAPNEINCTDGFTPIYIPNDVNPSFVINATTTVNTENISLVGTFGIAVNNSGINLNGVDPTTSNIKKSNFNKKPCIKKEGTIKYDSKKNTYSLTISSKQIYILNPSNNVIMKELKKLKNKKVVITGELTSHSAIKVTNVVLKK